MTDTNKNKKDLPDDQNISEKLRNVLDQLSEVDASLFEDEVLYPDHDPSEETRKGLQHQQGR